MIRALITDAETRKAFDVISVISFSFPSIPIIVGDVEGTKGSMRHLYKLYHSNIERIRNADVKLFIEDLEAISQKYQEDNIIFIPMEEKTTAMFYSYLQKQGRNNFVYLLPDEIVYNTLRNKGELNAYCAKNGISAPIYYDVNELTNLSTDKYPILLKPCVGSGSEGQYRLYKPEDFSESVKVAVSRRPYLAQELVGNGHDVKGAFYFYDDNGIVEAYTHERIRTSPPTGGVTVLSKMTHEQSLIEEGKKLLDKIGWQGLIMLEFIYDERTGKYKVIEANPRAWGSIMLSEYGGSHLLTNYIRRCLGEPFVIEHKAEECYIRWFFPVDLLNYIKSLGRIKGFWQFKNTCFINWSYATKASAIKFNISNLFSIKNIKRFMRK